jgi:hypothetical protein
MQDEDGQSDDDGRQAMTQLPEKTLANSGVPQDQGRAL